MTEQHLILTAIGLVAGVVGGLLGVGGSVVMIPAMMMFFEPQQHLYQGAAMIVNFFVVLPAVFQHRKAKAVLAPVVQMMIPAALIGVITGVWLSSGPWFHGAREVYLSRTFGIFLFYVAGYNIYRLWGTWRLADIGPDEARQIPKWKIFFTVGLPTGILGGLLGIGGGAIAVPLQQVVLRMPLRRAIANSATTILPLSFIGAIYKNYNNTAAGMPLHEALQLAAFLIPTAMIGGYLGARLTHVAPRRGLRLAFVALMCYAGFGLLRRSMEPYPSEPVPAVVPATSSSTDS